MENSTTIHCIRLGTAARSVRVYEWTTALSLELWCNYPAVCLIFLSRERWREGENWLMSCSSLDHTHAPSCLFSFLYDKALILNILHLNIALTCCQAEEADSAGWISLALICNQWISPTQETIGRFLTPRYLLLEQPASCNIRNLPLALWQCFD